MGRLLGRVPVLEMLLLASGCMGCGGGSSVGHDSGCPFRRGLAPIPNVIFDRPIEVLPVSNGEAMVRLRQPVSTGTIPWAAANNDGSRFAVVFAGGGNPQVLLLNSSLQQVSAYLAATVSSASLSRDGKGLYVAETSSGASFITVLDGQLGQLIGKVPDISIQGVASMMEEAEETQLLFALSNRGFSFVDTSVPGTISPAAPIVAPAPSVQPSEGPIAGGTSTILSGQNFAGPVQVKFGSQWLQIPRSAILKSKWFHHPAS